MFLDEKTQGEAAPVKTGALKLSEAIRIGHRMIEEDHEHFLTAGRGCALGAMWVGMGRSEDEWKSIFAPKGPIEGWRLMSHELGVPLALAESISERHCFGELRLSIADWLESEGH